MDERLGRAPAPEVGLIASGVLAGLGAVVLGNASLLLLVPAAVVVWSGTAIWRRVSPDRAWPAMACGVVLALAGVWLLVADGFSVGAWMLVVFGVAAVISVLHWWTDGP